MHHLVALDGEVGDHIADLLHPRREAGLRGEPADHRRTRVLALADPAAGQFPRVAGAGEHDPAGPVAARPEGRDPAPLAHGQVASCASTSAVTSVRSSASSSGRVNQRASAVEPPMSCTVGSPGWSTATR